MKARKQKDTASEAISRRDFLRIGSLMLGVMALPRTSVSALETALTPPEAAPRTSQLYFQWQNDILCKTIYPMREAKLRDFLNFYMEVDIWKHYKDRDPKALEGDVNEFKKAWESNAAASLKEYTTLRDYFLKQDAREEYSNYEPLDEPELAEINNLHSLFRSWPRDIRGERAFVEAMIAYWAPHRDSHRAWIRTRKRRHEAMDPAHPKYIPEGAELAYRENTVLPMAQHEMDKLIAFLATYDKIEKPKLAWFQQTRRDRNFKTPEAEYLVKFPLEQQVTKGDLARWKAGEYAKSIAAKNQYELLDLIHLRFIKEPKRFPLWLQYMVVHFSGMRYYSAHGSWADPRDLLVRLRAPRIEKEIKALDDAAIERLSREKVAAYETAVPVTGSGPKLAGAKEDEWREKIGWYLPNLKNGGPKTRRQGLIDLRKTEDAYEIWSRTTSQALASVRLMKGNFEDWAWKEIVKLTPLRVTEVTEAGWESLTPKEVEERNAYGNYAFRSMMDAWENADLSGWREENGRSLELIVSRLVCNETAEHCQHARGNLPPGGLAAKPKWYAENERKGRGAYFVKPTSARDYVQGASILWLRFVSFSSMNPSEWQIARRIETKQNVGLLPADLGTKNSKDGGWVYRYGDVTTRSRTTVTLGKQVYYQSQWLRWIHEATVAEVAETADGMMVLSFETALPGGDQATSAVGLFKAPLEWHLSDGTEDNYNRSFVGYVPEGQTPVEQLKKMLDWDKIFRL